MNIFQSIFYHFVTTAVHISDITVIDEIQRGINYVVSRRGILQPAGDEGSFQYFIAGETLGASVVRRRGPVEAGGEIKWLYLNR